MKIYMRRLVTSRLIWIYIVYRSNFFFVYRDEKVAASFIFNKVTELVCEAILFMSSAAVPTLGVGNQLGGVMTGTSKKYTEAKGVVFH